MRPAQYASSMAKRPCRPAQTTSTSPPPAAATATASRLRRLPTSTVSAPAAAAERIARVPFVVVRISVSPRGSTYSRGEFPRSKPGMATAFRSPPSTASPKLSLSASASSTSAQQSTRRYPDASAWAIVEVARSTSTTIAVGARSASVGVKATCTRIGP